MCLTPDSAEFDASMQKLVDVGLAIANGADDALTWVAYAAGVWEIRDLQATSAALDKAIARATQLTQKQLSLAYSSRSICQLQLGHIEAAEADATASLELDPRSHPLGLRGFIRYYKGEYEAALRDAEESIRIKSDDAELRAWRGLILLALGRHTEAMQDLDAAIASGECERYNSELHMARARAYLALGQPEAAECDCSEAIGLDNHERTHWPFVVRERAAHAQDAYLLRAEARLAQGAYARALGDCGFAASIAPGDPAVYELRARVYHAIGNFGEVINDTIRASHLREPATESPEPTESVARQPVAVA